MNVVRTKDGVQFATIAPGGFRILSAIDQTAKSYGINLTITSGTDGMHSGPNDPHHRGEAYDLRTQDMAEQQKQDVLDKIMALLGYDWFYGFIEDSGTGNEHIHLQVRKGIIYPPVIAVNPGITAE